jgi:hypothetical protein
LIPLALLLIPIVAGLYAIRGDYGKKDLENANRKAPRGLEIPFGAFILCLSSFLLKVN